MKLRSFSPGLANQIAKHRVKLHKGIDAFELVQRCNANIIGSGFIACEKFQHKNDKATVYRLNLYNRENSLELTYFESKHPNIERCVPFKNPTSNGLQLIFFDIDKKVNQMDVLDQRGRAITTVENLYLQDATIIIPHSFSLNDQAQHKVSLIYAMFGNFGIASHSNQQGNVFNTSEQLNNTAENITAMTYNPRTSIVYAAYADHYIESKLAETGKEKGILIEGQLLDIPDKSQVIKLSLSRGENYLAVADSEGCVYLYETKDFKEAGNHPVGITESTDGKILDIKFVNNDKDILLVTTEGTETLEVNDLINSSKVSLK